MFVGVQPLLKLGLLPASPATLLSWLGSAWKTGTLSIVTYGGLSWSYLSAQMGKRPSSLGGL